MTLGAFGFGDSQKSKIFQLLNFEVPELKRLGGEELALHGSLYLVFSYFGGSSFFPFSFYRWTWVILT